MAPVDERTWRMAAKPKTKGRSEFERDRDRLLYSSNFHRLAGITQIVRAGEADYFHTRQQHTLKVAQLGRRLAQQCVTEQPAAAIRWGIDPEVVEAACLAHDMGHPPFGHVGEAVLDELVRDEEPDMDGFEGNAQSFRIITKLAVHSAVWPGFDLTRATMAAVLKYPWLQDTSVRKKRHKWSAYRSEKTEFEFARAAHPHEDQTAEAALMDWADDIAYSVHDLEDFHRAGVLPWHLIFEDAGSAKLVQRAHDAWFGAPADGLTRLTTAMGNFKGLFMAYEALVKEPYTGSKEHRQSLRSLTSALVGRYVNATRLSDNTRGEALAIPDKRRDEISILKQITRDYVISSPTLAAQQLGQRRVI